MKKSFILLLVCFTQLSYSQTNRTKAAVSVLAGNQSIGVGINYYYQADLSVEAIFSADHDRSRHALTVLAVERFNTGLAGFKLVAGAGLHAGKAKRIFQTGNINLKKIEEEGGTVPQGEKGKWFAGGDAMIGIQYKIKALPVVAGVELKPYVDFINGRSSFTNASLRLSVQL